MHRHAKARAHQIPLATGHREIREVIDMHTDAEFEPGNEIDMDMESLDETVEQTDKSCPSVYATQTDCDLSDTSKINMKL